MQIAKWKSYGAQIVVSKANVSNLEETRSLLDEANVLGPVAAIFNLAAVRMSFFFYSDLSVWYLRICKLVQKHSSF